MIIAAIVMTRPVLFSGFVTRLTRLVSLVEQELPTLPQHLSSPPAFSGVRVRGGMCLFCRSLFVLLYFVLYCIVCSSSIYGLWLPLSSMLQTIYHN